jgi:Uma2 family endonuclease
MVMSMRVPLPTYTVADLETFPDDGCRYELLNGLLLVTPAPGNAHQVVASRMMVTLTNYLGDRAPAVVVGPGVVQRPPLIHLEPDLLVYPGHFKPDAAWLDMSDWWLAVEVSGRSSRVYDRDYKRAAYLALGVREVWLVDLQEQAVLVSRRGDDRWMRQAEAVRWHPPEMATALVVDLRKDLFKDFTPPLR